VGSILLVTCMSSNFLQLNFGKGYERLSTDGDLIDGIASARVYAPLCLDFFPCHYRKRLGRNDV
jgi:hypothetical protein